MVEWLDKECEAALEKIIEKYGDQQKDIQITKMDMDRGIVEKLIAYGSFKSESGVRNDELGNWSCFISLTDSAREYFEFKEKEETKDLNDWELLLWKLIKLCDISSKRVYQYDMKDNDRATINKLKEMTYVKDTRVFAGESIALTLSLDALNYFRKLKGEELIGDNTSKAKPKEREEKSGIKVDGDNFFKSSVMALEAIKQNLDYSGLGQSYVDDLKELVGTALDCCQYSKRVSTTALLKEIKIFLVDADCEQLACFLVGLI